MSTDAKPPFCLSRTPSANLCVVLFGLVNRGPEIYHEFGPNHPQQVKARLTSRRLEERPRVSLKMNDLKSWVDDQPRRGVLIENHLLGLTA